MSLKEYILQVLSPSNHKLSKQTLEEIDILDDLYEKSDWDGIKKYLKKLDKGRRERYFALMVMYSDMCATVDDICEEKDGVSEGLPAGSDKKDA